MNQKTVQEESNDAIVPGTFGGEFGAIHQKQPTQMVIEEGRNSIIDGSQSGLSYNTGPKNTITQMQEDSNQFALPNEDMSFNPSNLNAVKPNGPPA